MSKKVYVGLSGGVDSSVTAALLKQQGYDVTGVYMKNWSQDLPGFPCPWKQDYQDAKRVAVQLGIPFEMFDFEDQYRQKVVDYMLDGFRAGITPNPDVMCNQEIKFKLFLDTALERGADMIAMGHYARIMRSGEGSKKNEARSSAPAYSILPTPYSAALYTARDGNKDQTYFLYRITKDALKKTLFPLADYTKPQVKALAKKMGLVTAGKKESMGICFVGKVGIKEFLLNQIGPQKSGDILDQNNKVIGQHDGAIFYTIGQRHGLDVGGGLPYYVIGKDMAKNQVFVTNNIDDKNLWHKEFALSSLHWINQPPKNGQKLSVRTRHRAPLEQCVIKLDGQKAIIKLDGQLRALTPGQSAVLYDDDHVLGGGIIT